MEILQMPKYIYIVIVSSLEKHNFEFPFTILLSLISTIFLTPIFLTIYIIFHLYKQCVKSLIQKLYPDVFVDLMEGLDSICCNQINCIPNVLLLIDTKDDTQTLFKKTLTMIKSAMHSDHQKLFYSRGSFLGYHYFYKNNLKAKDYILQTDDIDIKSKRHLSEAFHKYDVGDMPDRGHALLQVILFGGRVSDKMASSCEETIKTNKTANDTTPPIIHGLKLIAFRLHHCLGDGKAIMNLFVSIFGDVEVSLSVCASKRKYSDIPLGKLTPEVNRLKEWPSGLSDDNALRGYNLSEEKHIAWYSDEGKECMRKIRELRRGLTGVTFLDVVNTCIASSLYDYYEYHQLPIPQTVIGGVVLSPAIYSFSYGVGKFTMTNRFSAAAFHMPIGIGDCKLISRLRHVKKEYDSVKKCVDVQFNYWLAQNICQTLPSALVRVVCEKVPVTFGVSSLPGCETFTLFAGSPVRDFVFMLPNSPHCGLHFVIYTYGGNFRFALTADKSIVPTHQEAQNIVNGVISYLNEMHALCIEGKLKF